MGRLGDAHIGVTVNIFGTVTLVNTGVSHNFVPNSSQYDKAVEITNIEVKVLFLT